MAKDAAPAAPPTAASSSIRIRLSEDGMRAYLDLFRAPAEVKLQLEDFESAFKTEGCDPKFLNPERALEAAEAWNKDHQPQEGVLVAESIRFPTPGKDGRLEFLIDLNNGVKPSEAAGKVDHRNVHSIRAVEKGQPLVRRIPPEKGVPGLDLRGKEFPAPDGKDMPLPAGEQVATAPNDPETLVAAVSGYVEWAAGRLNVRDRFVVNGSVDYTSGNIDYARSVTVKGDIQDGFTVRVGGDLEVGGLVGDAQVTVEGKVLIVGGFVGMGQGRLNSKGEVQVGFVSNQIVRCYQSVTVAKESFNAKLYAKEQLIVKGPVVGGLSMAGLRMECKALGNDLGTRTDVELGVDYLDFDRRLELERKLRDLAVVWQKIRLRMAKIREAFQKTRKLSPADAKQLFELRGKANEISAVLPGLEARKTEIAERIKQGYLRKGIELKVEGKIYPGVLIKAENQSLRIPEEVSGPRLLTYFDERIHLY